MTGILLAFDPDRTTPLTDEVQQALDDRRIAYGVVFVESYAEPRLTAGSGELIGQEILDRLDDIEEVARL